MLLNYGNKYCGLMYVGSPVNVKPNSHKKLPFKCECGRTKDIRIGAITAGNTKSCGKCNNIILNNGERYMNFTYVGPTVDVGPNGSIKLPFKCRCGNIKKIKIANITSGNTTTCYECNSISLHRDEEYNGFIYIGDSITLSRHSHKKLLFKCKCGRIKEISLQNLSKNTSTCGQCNKIILNHGDEYHGFIYVGNSTEIWPNSNKKLPFKCKCGNVKNISLCNITRGITKSCWDCRDSVYRWYQNNLNLFRSRSKFDIHEFPANGIKISEPIRNARSPFRARCPVCNSEYKPRLSDIRRGRSLTCGCISYKISSLNKDIAAFIESLSLHVISEFKIDNRYFDICIPSRNLLVEVNGIKWHSMGNSKNRDKYKYDIAAKNGYRLIMIFEDEWKSKRQIFESILCNQIGLSKPIILRASNCVIKEISAGEANKIYESYHYIGKCNSKIHYGIYYGDILIGCASFRKPSRQTCKYDHELSRMVMHPCYRAYGIWTKLIHKFIDDYNPKSIVSFSDNRLFTGSVYDKMGFKLDGEVRSDYYWVKGNKRYHKSGLRKPKGCTDTETVLRKSEGYRKIWDLGKKRWILRIQ